ncbi:MAG: lamin tail domain-containing protein, partial [Thermoplasmata archaeon]
MRRGRAFDGTRFHYSLYMLLLFFLILAIHPLNLTSCVKAQGPEEDVVINEIMLLPGEGGVWIEIHNTGNEFVSLDEWLISDEDGLTYQLPNLPDMPPQSYIVVHFDSGESDIEFGQTQPNALHIYTGWKNVRFTRHFVDSDERAARCAVGHDMVTGGKPEVLVNKFKSGKFFYESKADMSDEWIRSDITAPGDPSETHRIKPIDVD